MAEKEIFLLDPLFYDVQMQQIFSDSKTFVDCISKIPTAVILKKYLAAKNKPGFDLKTFVLKYFYTPEKPKTGIASDLQKSTYRHIIHLWPVLTRQPDSENGSLIPLPHPYIIPGGRFREIYYWDSYFTMLGLKESGYVSMIENMIDNFSHLIKVFGFIPNGNRTYYLGRSQPPIYSLMVQLLAQLKGDIVLTKYLPYLVKEYNFWTRGNTLLTRNTKQASHSVRLNDGEILNRYFDEFATARPESYREDTALSKQISGDAHNLFRNLRAGAESGWDFSSRWFEDSKSLKSINTTNLVAVDLNCLLYHLENKIADGFKLKNNKAKNQFYLSRADQRKKAIQKYCWNKKEGFYFDYDIKNEKQTKAMALSGIMPLYFSVANQEQADSCARIIKKKFLKPGGVVTTLKNTGQQWDAPNGWAPLQWITIRGLENYGYHSLAKEIAHRWISLNDKVYKATGKMMEKYNVENLNLLAGGGEYPSQDGFGWTNGIYLALHRKYRNIRQTKKASKK
ncbi:MAG: alpha,alpha-trehalase TreF [Chitinophagaceae bacterium]|nr:alpha,alpha-trehalase TreF [Chitinophagaceae bacterium]